MTPRKVNLLFFLLIINVLTACVSEKEADATSERVQKDYEEYLSEIAQQEPYNRYTKGVTIKLDDKGELKLNIGSTYQFHYHIEVTTNDQFATLTPLEQFELIYSFKNSLKNVAKEEYGKPGPTDIESHDVLYIDKDFLHVIGKNDIFFIQGPDRYSASIHEMNAAERYEYKGTEETNLKILEVNGEAHKVEAFYESIFDQY
jgi:hypothetical protein